MPTTSKGIYKESDGLSVTVQLTYPVESHAVVYAQGWLGVSSRSANSGEYTALRVGGNCYQFVVPSGLTVNKGDTVFIDAAQLGSSHMPPDAAYGTSAGAGKVPLFKATAAKDANNVVTGILLGLYIYAS